MARAGEYHDAFLVIKGAHALAALRDDGGRSDSLQGHAAFFADGPEAMEIHLVAEGVDFVHDALLSAGSNWSVGVMERWAMGIAATFGGQCEYQILQHSSTPSLPDLFPCFRSLDLF